MKARLWKVETPSSIVTADGVLVVQKGQCVAVIVADEWEPEVRARLYKFIDEQMQAGGDR